MGVRIIPAREEKRMYDCDKCGRNDIGADGIDARIELLSRDLAGYVALETEVILCRQCRKLFEDWLSKAK